MNFLDSLNEQLNSCIKLPEQRIYNNSESRTLELQRSENWHIDRIGKVTGSKTDPLMSCTQFSKNMPWSAPEKVLDFGIGFKKIVYRMYLTTRFNTYFEQLDAKNFKYGRIIEPYIISKIPSEFEYYETEFIDIIPNVFGASPDGKLIKKSNGEIYGFECKAAMDTDTVFSRIETNFDEKHTDFWQTQTEMISLGATKLLYATSIPAKSIIKVLSLDEKEDNTLQLSELIPGVIMKVISKSETHCKALIERAKIAGLARDIKLKKENKSIDSCIFEAAQVLID